MAATDDPNKKRRKPGRFDDSPVVSVRQKKQAAAMGRKKRKTPKETPASARTRRASQLQAARTAAHSY
jgi:hypothetical protein